MSEIKCSVPVSKGMSKCRTGMLYIHVQSTQIAKRGVVSCAVGSISTRIIANTNRYPFSSPLNAKQQDSRHSVAMTTFPAEHTKKLYELKTRFACSNK